MLYSQNKKRGFTLVELIVVLVILAILAALLIPALTGYIDKAKKDQVISETRMLHEAVQTEVSELYASAEWNSKSTYFTIANNSGHSCTGNETSEFNQSYQTRYQEIVKLAEVPSLENGTGGFVAAVTPNGKVYSIIYNSGRGYLGLYFSETQEYLAYKLGDTTANGTIDDSIYSQYYYSSVIGVRIVDGVDYTSYSWKKSGILGTLGIGVFNPNE